MARGKQRYTTMGNKRSPSEHQPHRHGRRESIADPVLMSETTTASDRRRRPTAEAAYVRAAQTEPLKKTCDHAALSRVVAPGSHRVAALLCIVPRGSCTAAGSTVCGLLKGPSVRLR